MFQKVARIGTRFQVVSVFLDILANMVRPNHHATPLASGTFLRLFLHSSSGRLGLSGCPQERWAGDDGRRDRSGGGQRPAAGEKKGKSCSGITRRSDTFGRAAPPLQTGGRRARIVAQASACAQATQARCLCYPNPLPEGEGGSLAAPAVLSVTYVFLGGTPSQQRPGRGGRPEIRGA